MDPISLVTSKRETRQFLERSIGEEAIDIILNAGRLAGSAKNRQPWHFILLKDRDRLKGLAAHGNSTTALMSATVVVVIVIPNEYMQDRFDAGRAAQNMMFTAHSMGIGSCPVTLHDAKGAKEYLGVPKDLEVQIALAFGYPQEIKRKGKVSRKSLGEILHRERW